MPPRILLPLIAFFAFVPAASLRAVVVSQDNSSTYTQAPVSDDFGFASVGTVFNSIAGFPASGVYLGDGWMLSAYHNVANGNGGFTFGGVTLGGIGYTVDPSTGTRLHNPTNNSLADLAMFRLTVEPENVPAVNLASVAPSPGISARMMGNGQDRALTETSWSTATNPWTEVPVGGNRSGYELIGGRTMRWGTNTIETEPILISDQGFGPIDVFTLDFDRIAGEGMATFGDSGGGVFTKNGSIWELAGIMVLTDQFTGQPAGTVVYGNATSRGNSTYAANIATYKPEIIATMAAVPEPSTVILLFAGSVCLIRRRRTLIHGSEPRVHRDYRK